MTEGFPRGRRWGRFHPGKTYQVEAFDRETGRAVRLWSGDAERFRQRTRDGFLLCPVREPDGSICGRPYATTVNGHGRQRDHFRHGDGDGERHPSRSRESKWHVLAKQTLQEWAERQYGAEALRIEVEGPRLAAGSHGRIPDVRIERPGLPVVAVEVCLTSPATGADWWHRHRDYLEQGIVAVWMLSDIADHADIKVGATKRGRSQVLVRPKGVALEMLRRGVVPLWLHLPEDTSGVRHR